MLTVVVLPAWPLPQAHRGMAPGRGAAVPRRLALGLLRAATPEVLRTGPDFHYLFLFFFLSPPRLFLASWIFRDSPVPCRPDFMAPWWRELREMVLPLCRDMNQLV